MSFFDNTKQGPTINLQLVTAALITGLLSALLAITLKHATEHFELNLLASAQKMPALFVILPLIGLSSIYFLRQYFFRRKANKGIREIFDLRSGQTKTLPAYKIPSHFINGFITVIFGGSTGIEVSTVVAAAAVGSQAQRKDRMLLKHKSALVSAGVAAGISALFCSAPAGLLFALEVITKKRTRPVIIATVLALIPAVAVAQLSGESPLFAMEIRDWHWHAAPYFLLMGLLAAGESVYLTRTVLSVKRFFSTIRPGYTILGCSVFIGLCVAFVPALYGDGYHAVRELLSEHSSMHFSSISIPLIAVLVLKPLVTSATLASGGDGGVFAPSLILGAFLGYLIAASANIFLGAQLITANFVVIGMVAMLSASIHAPLTAIMLVCAIVNDYSLLVPAAVVAFVSKYAAQWIYPFTVYSFSAPPYADQAN